MREQRREKGARLRGAGEQTRVVQEVRREQGGEEGAGSCLGPEGGQAGARGPGEGSRGRGDRRGAGPRGDVAPWRQKVGGVTAQGLLPLPPLGPSVLEPDLRRKENDE